MQQIKEIPCASLTLNDANPRSIKDHKFQKLIYNLETFPALLKLRPVVYDDKDNNKVLGGNMRLRGAIHLGWETIPAIKASDCSDDEKKAFIILDNQDFGEWDFDTLAANYEPSDLIALGFEAQELGLKITDPEFAVADADGGDSAISDGAEFEKSHVKMVQLFFNTKTYPEFVNFVNKLEHHFKTGTVTDTVYKVMQDAYNKLPETVR